MALLENATYTGLLFTFGKTIKGCLWTADGTVMYQSDGYIAKYTCVTPFNIQAMTNNGTVYTPATSSSITDMCFGDDGNIIFYTNDTNNSIHSYELATAYDVSTLLTATEKILLSAGTQPFGVDVSPDGTRMITYNSSDDLLHQWNMSVPFDITSAVASGTYNPSTIYAQGIRMNRAGTVMFMIDNIGDRIMELNLSVGWELSSASNPAIYMATGYNTCQGLVASPDLYHFAFTDTSGKKAYQYSIPIPIFVGGSATVSVTATGEGAVIGIPPLPPTRTGFTFVQEIELAQIKTKFRFVQEIEQLPLPILITRSS